MWVSVRTEIHLKCLNPKFRIIIKIIKPSLVMFVGCLRTELLFFSNGNYNRENQVISPLFIQIILQGN